MSRNSGLGGGRAKSCFGSSIPNPKLFPVPSEVDGGILYLTHALQRRGLAALRQSASTLLLPFLFLNLHEALWDKIILFLDIFQATNG